MTSQSAKITLSAVAFLSALLLFVTCNGYPNRENSDAPPTIGVYKKNFAGRITKVISEKGNSDATLPELKIQDHIWEGVALELHCEAGYPVQWVYHGLGAPQVRVETLRQADNFHAPETYRFASTVTFSHTTERQTGNYSCESVHNPNLQTYIYLFVPGNQLFLNQKSPNDIVTISPKASESWITLPCAVTDKTAVVRLYKNSQSGVVQELKDPYAVTYDPTLGFRLKSRGSSSDFLGNYFCKAQLHSHQEKLHFRIAAPQYVIAGINLNGHLENDDHLVYTSTSSSPPISFEYDKERRTVKCCSNHSRPKLRQTGCESISDCNLRKKFLKGTSCSGHCEQASIVDGNCEAYPLASYKDSGLVQCSMGSMKQYFMYSYDDGTFIADFKKMPKLNEILELRKEGSNSKGKSIFSCYYNTFFFSQGIKWGRMKHDGHLEIIQEERFPASHTFETDETSSSAVYCFAPVWNSATEWRNVSLTI